MTTRRRARQVVLQLLFLDDVNPVREAQEDDRFLSRRLLSNKPLIGFAAALLRGVREHRAALDKVIGENAANWSVKRMSTIDRNILRMAAYEIYHSDVPPPVVINEAIELAKRFGQQNSGVLVNGILDRTLKTKAASAATA